MINASSMATQGIMDTLKENDPQRFEKLGEMTAEQWANHITTELGGASAAGDQQQFPFKPRPLGGNWVCYLIAELNYANDLSICALITDPKLRADCEKAAKIAYCAAYDLCGGGKA